MGRWGSSAGRFVAAALVVASAGVIVKAATLSDRYQAELQRLRREWQAAQQAEGLAGSAQRKALYAKYPTPELTLGKVVQLAPGGSAPLTVTGTFSPQTTFLVQNDQLTLDAPSVASGRFSATVTAAPDALPTFARLYAYTPVSGAWRDLPAVLVGTPPTFTLTASNGWTVSLVPQAPAFRVDGTNASVTYKAEFRKPGETAPFETATGTMTLDGDRPPTAQWSFSLASAESGSAMAEMQEIQAQMSDPQAFMKMSDAQRDALMARLEKVSERLGKETEAMLNDPSIMQRKQDAFGCQHIALDLSAPTVSGSISCGKDVGRLELTGTRLAANK